MSTVKTTTKSAKTAAKPRVPKPATAKATEAKAVEVKAAKAPTPPTREQIARLAEQFWLERGRHGGSAEHDWLRAEQELMGKAS